MSLIHEQLYQTENLAQIDFEAYVKRLTTSLMRSYNLSANVRLEMIFDGPILLSLNEAIPCGLIVNELVTNALKHGFANRQAGTVQVGLHLADQQIKLVVADDGVGLPPDFDLYPTDSLGLQLVTLLTKQLQGSISLAKDPQTQFTICFPSRVSD
jgi:two-component sensor histidine kinase